MTRPTLIRKLICLGLAYSFQGFSPLLSYWGAWQHAGRHGAGKVAERSISGPNSITLPGTHFLFKVYICIFPCSACSFLLQICIRIDTDRHKTVNTRQS